MKKRIIQFIVMTFIVLVNLLSGTSVAQETTVLDSAKVNEIKAIETTELNTEIQKTARFLTETESWLSQFHHLVLLEKQLNEISATSEVFEKSAASFEIDGLGGRSLNGIRNKWKRLESRTTKVQQELGESQQEIEKRIGILERFPNPCLATVAFAECDKPISPTRKRVVARKTIGKSSLVQYIQLQTVLGWVYIRKLKRLVVLDSQ